MHSAHRYLTLALLSSTLLITAASRLSAANPIIPGYADPAMREYNGRMYMVVGQDESPKTKGFSMPSWAIISSADLVNWKKEVTIDPKDTYLGAGNKRCWAADFAPHKGKWYFFFSNGGTETGVLVADKVNGPYVDVLKKPLVPGPHNYDPTIFTDDDGQHYLTFGRDGNLNNEIIHYQIAKLADNMISLAEKPKDLMTTEKYGFGTEKAARDHSYFHKHNGTYYLSCAGVYMSSLTLTGTYSNRRNTGQDGGHTSFGDFNGQSYHAWEWTCDSVPAPVRTYRQVMLTYLHYRDNGDMISDPFFLKGHPGYDLGVGNYDANWEKIEAEWFFKKSGGVKKDGPDDGFEIQDLKNGDYLDFPNTKNLAANTKVSFSASSEAASKIEIRSDSPTGTLLGTCEVPSTDSWKTYKTVSTTLKNPAGTSNLFLVFKGGKGDLLHLDFLSFK